MEQGGVPHFIGHVSVSRLGLGQVTTSGGRTYIERYIVGFNTTPEEGRRPGMRILNSRVLGTGWLGLGPSRSPLSQEKFWGLQLVIIKLVKVGTLN